MFWTQSVAFRTSVGTSVQWEGNPLMLFISDLPGSPSPHINLPTNWFQKHVGFPLPTLTDWPELQWELTSRSDFNALSNNLWFIYVKDLGLFRCFYFCEQNTPFFVQANSCLKTKISRKDWRELMVVGQATHRISPTQPLSVIKHQPAPGGDLRLWYKPTEARKLRIRAAGQRALPAQGRRCFDPVPAPRVQVLPVIS